VANLLRTLSSQGWVLHGVSDMMKKAVNKDTLFFRAAPPVEVSVALYYDTNTAEHVIIAGVLLRILQ
jgi:hypothetical protein